MGNVPDAAAFDAALARWLFALDGKEGRFLYRLPDTPPYCELAAWERQLYLDAAAMAREALCAEPALFAQLAGLADAY